MGVRKEVISRCLEQSVHQLLPQILPGLLSGSPYEFLLKSLSFVRQNAELQPMFQLSLNYKILPFFTVSKEKDLIPMSQKLPKKVKPGPLFLALLK